jgi:hypothetical protein
MQFPDFTGSGARKQIRLAGRSNTRANRSDELRVKREQRQQRQDLKQREEASTK